MGTTRDQIRRKRAIILYLPLRWQQPKYSVLHGPEWRHIAMPFAQSSKHGRPLINNLTLSNNYHAGSVTRRHVTSTDTSEPQTLEEASSTGMHRYLAVFHPLCLACMMMQHWILPPLVLTMHWDPSEQACCTTKLKPTDVPELLFELGLRLVETWCSKAASKSLEDPDVFVLIIRTKGQTLYQLNGKIK